MARRPSSVCLSACKLLRKSLLLADKWPDRHQTFTRWTPGQHASSMCSRSRSRSKVTWYAHFLGFLEWATPWLTVWLFNIFIFSLLTFSECWWCHLTPLQYFAAAAPAKCFNCKTFGKMTTSQLYSLYSLMHPLSSHSSGVQRARLNACVYA